jgi:hypothetical protein
MLESSLRPITITYLQANSHFLLRSSEDSASHCGPLSYSEALKGVFMVHRKNAGKLLLFLAPTAVPGSPAENWSLRILETKDNLTSALEFLRITYNEMLASRPVKSVDEVLARVETILRNDAKIPAYTVVAAIRIHGSISPEPKRKVPLLFPAV